MNDHTPILMFTFVYVFLYFVIYGVTNVVILCIFLFFYSVCILCVYYKKGPLIFSSSSSFFPCFTIIETLKILRIM